MNRTESTSDVPTKSHMHRFYELDNYGTPTGHWVCKEPTCEYGLASGRPADRFTATALENSIVLTFLPAVDHTEGTPSKPPIPTGWHVGQGYDGMDSACYVADCDDPNHVETDHTEGTP